MATSGGPLPPTMQALVFAGARQIELATQPTPQVLHPRDVVVKVASAGICGSDLHPFHEREKGIAKGCVTGHEFVGHVVSKGAEVVGLQLGDRVVSPFTANCGQCFFCTQGATCRCSHPQARLFGWVTEDDLGLPAEERCGLQGAQAQYVRVPLADATLLKMPEQVSDDEALLLGDILSTAFFCAENGGVGPGSKVAVVGCGPVGLLAVMACKHLGAAQVWAVDCVPERLQLAASLGAEPLDFSKVDVPAAIKEATGGVGADVALEVVGAKPALRLAFEAVRPAGTLSSCGVHSYPDFPFSPVECYDKNLTFKAGRCPARHYMQKLLGELFLDSNGSSSSSAVGGGVAARPKQDWSRVITHRMPLSQGVEGYRLFDSKADGCIKVVLDCTR